MIHLRLLRLAGPAAPLLLAVVTVGVTLSAVAVIQAVAIAGLFTGIVSGATLHELAVPALVFAGALLVRPLLAVLREVTVHGVAGRIKAQLRMRILDAEITAGPITGAGARSGERQSLLVDAVENLEPYFGRYLPQVVVTFVTSVSLVIALVLIDPVTGLIVGAVALVVPFLPRLWDAALAGRGDEHWGAYSALHSDVVDSVRGMPTLKALGATKHRRTELVKAGESLLAATLAQLRLSLVESGLTGFFLIAGPAVALITGVVQVRNGALDAASLFLITMLAFEAFRPFRDLANHWHAGYAGVSAGNRILALLDTSDSRSAHDGGQAFHRLVDQSRGGSLGSQSRADIPRATVAASGVTFRYPGGDRDALSDVSFRIKEGTTTAVVGASGSGKSTLASLLLGFATPDSGELTLGDVPTPLLGQEGCSRAVSIVSQDPVIFAGSIRHNLLLVAPSATEQDLVAAIHDAGAEELLDTARGGLDAPVGDNGGLLSGGQRQRLAIARALLRDSPVLLLDEASSALDARREHAILARLRETRRRDGSPRTVIVIAHRLAATTDADQIIVLDAGRVAEAGRYDELLARDGVLARLHAAQFDGVLS